MRKSHALRLCLFAFVGMATAQETAEKTKPRIGAYKCTDANGTVIFSQNPCGNDAKFIDTTSAERMATQTESDKLRGIELDCKHRMDESVKSYDLQIADTQSQIDSLRYSMRSSANNLAGATRNNAIEQHIAALEARNTAILNQRNDAVLAANRQCDAARKSVESMEKP